MYEQVLFHYWRHQLCTHFIQICFTALLNVAYTFSALPISLLPVKRLESFLWHVYSFLEVATKMLTFPRTRSRSEPSSQTNPHPHTEKPLTGRDTTTLEFTIPKWKHVTSREEGKFTYKTMCQYPTNRHQKQNWMPMFNRRLATHQCDEPWGNKV